MVCIEQVLKSTPYHTDTLSVSYSLIVSSGHRKHTDLLLVYHSRSRHLTIGDSSKPDEGAVKLF